MHYEHTFHLNTIVILKYSQIQITCFPMYIKRIRIVLSGQFGFVYPCLIQSSLRIYLPGTARTWSCSSCQLYPLADLL